MSFRFKRGDSVWVRDPGSHGGYQIHGPVIVQETHSHPGRHPFYPNGEGYAFNYRGPGDEFAFYDENPGHNKLYWDCYPGCRVWATREEALAARLTEDWIRSAIRDGKLP